MTIGERIKTLRRKNDLTQEKLAEMEYFMAYEDTCKEDPAKPYSLEMMNRSIRHSNMVIEESTDPRLREKAIWNAMICCQYSGRYEEALPPSAAAV